jgi:Domain of unknown function (DUF6265)
MTQLSSLILGLLAVAALRSRTSPQATSSAPSPPRADVMPLAWMAGCWAHRTGTRTVEEQWMAPSGGSLIGMGRTVDGGVLRGWEALRIVTQNDKVVYIAQPNGGTPTSFAEVTMNDSVAVFENPTHDFPQRIAYRRVHADSIVATVSAQRDGRARGMQIPMGRVRCGGA